MFTRHVYYALLCFPTASRYLKESIKRLIDDRKARPPTSGRETILDDLMSYSDDVERQLDDAVTFTVGGFHNNSTALHITAERFHKIKPKTV